MSSETSGLFLSSFNGIYVKIKLVLILKEKILRIFLILSSALLVFSLALIVFNFKRLNPPLVLHFDEFKGVDFLGGKFDFFGIWLASFFMTALNLFLGETLFNRERALCYFLIGINVLIALLILIISAVIVSVN